MEPRRPGRAADPGRSSIGWWAGGRVGGRAGCGARAGEVLVRVRAAGVDAGVRHLLTGLPYLLRLMGYGLRAPRVPVCGREVAGRAEAVGAGVSRFRPGDEVFGFREGAFAEYVSAGEERFAARPANLTVVQAAAVPLSAVTALQALRDGGRVRAGRRVLVGVVLARAVDDGVGAEGPDQVRLRRAADTGEASLRSSTGPIRWTSAGAPRYLREHGARGKVVITMCRVRTAGTSAAFPVKSRNAAS